MMDVSIKQRKLLMALREGLIVFLRALDDYLDLPQTIPTRKQKRAGAICVGDQRAVAHRNGQSS